jgi:hypothetical protein
MHNHLIPRPWEGALGSGTDVELGGGIVRKCFGGDPKAPAGSDPFAARRFVVEGDGPNRVGNAAPRATVKQFPGAQRVWAIPSDLAKGQAYSGSVVVPRPS